MGWDILRSCRDSDDLISKIIIPCKEKKIILKINMEIPLQNFLELRHEEEKLNK